MTEIKVKDKIKGKIVRTYYDYNLLAVVIILMCFGLVMLYSASSYEASNVFNGNDLYYLQRQMIFGFVAIIIAIFISKMDYHLFFRFSTLIYIASILAMAAVRFTPLGVTINGARRWLGIGSFTVQPSEFAKIAVIIYITSEIFRLGREFYTFRGTMRVFLFGAISAVSAYLFTDNLSTAIIILLISVIMIFIAHPKTKPFIVFIIVVAVVIAAALIYLRNNMETSTSFRLRRILVWMNPEEYSDLGGWQVLQGLYAIGSGGLFGKGLGNSTQKLDTIPEAQNDMIFSIICEELGLFGAILVLLLFAYLLYRLLFIAINASDLKGCLVAAGIFSHIALQVILNICVVLNIIPTTGVTLPFVSYGGTSIVFLMIEIGLALGIGSQIQMEVRPPKVKRSARAVNPAGAASKKTEKTNAVHHRQKKQ